MEWYLAPFRKYADFNGRARRKEYWTFMLGNAVIFGLGGAMSELGLGFVGIIFSLLSIAIIVPSLAVTWRRLHDIGKSGKWYFICLIPLVGSIILLIQTLKDSEPGDNQYGPNPKAGEQA